MGGGAAAATLRPGRNGPSVRRACAGRGGPRDAVGECGRDACAQCVSLWGIPSISVLFYLWPHARPPPPTVTRPSSIAFPFHRVPRFVSGPSPSAEGVAPHLLRVARRRRGRTRGSLAGL